MAAGHLVGNRLVNLTISDYHPLCGLTYGHLYLTFTELLLCATHYVRYR